MVRLVFRPYIQVWRTICTSVSLRASTRVSPGLTLLRYSSPSFGSQHVRSNSNIFPKSNVGLQCSWFESCFRLCVEASILHTCAYVWTPWSVFQDGPLNALQANTSECASRAICFSRFEQACFSVVYYLYIDSQKTHCPSANHRFEITCHLMPPEGGIHHGGVIAYQDV